MTLEVSEEALDRTENCWRDFQCLSGDGKGTCEVLDVIGGVLFVEEGETIYCPYRTGFGYHWICWCPVRHEIHERYER